MVKPRKVDSGIGKEFEGGILPGLGTVQPSVSRTEQQTVSQPAVKTTSQHDGERKKITVYVDEDHPDLIDDILTEMKRRGLPRDNSMLIRALLNQAREVLADNEKMTTLVRACEQTLPKTASR